MAEATLTVPDEATTPVTVPDQDQTDAELQEFLTPQPEPAGTEPGPEDRTDTDADSVEAEARQAEIRAEAERIAAEQRKAEREKEAEESARLERERQVEGINAAYRARTAQLAKALDAEGVSAELKEQVLAHFNEHHAQAQTFHGSNFTNGLYQALAKRLPEDKREEFMASRAKHKGYDDVLSAFEDYKVTSLRDGYIAQKDADVLVAKGKLAYKRELMANGGAKARALLSQAAGSPGTPQGTTSAVPTWQQWDAMTLEQRAEWERKDPQILGKIR